MDKLKNTTPEERATVQTMMMKEKLVAHAAAASRPSRRSTSRPRPRCSRCITSSEGPLIKMRKAKAIEAQRDASLQKVLLPPQYQQWLAEKEAMRQKVEEKLMEKRQGGGN